MLIRTDDVLKYMGHDLEKYKGCDILDLNPGACLWSQKLHDFLQPRSHVLLEPAIETFKDFLFPLLNAPDSTYKLVTKDPQRMETYTELFDEGLFPHQARADPADAAPQELNKTLLVTGSLVWDPRLPGLGFDSMAKQLFYLFSQYAWSHDAIHACGPVRTLLWMQHDDFNFFVAQSNSGMQKANSLLEMLQEINMVVTAERKDRNVGKGSLGRDPQYELESLVRALQSGRAKGKKVPAHRRDFTHDFAAHVEKVSGGSGITSAEYTQEYLHAQQLAGTVPVGLLGKSLIDNINLELELRSQFPELELEVVPLHHIVHKKTEASEYKDHPARKQIEKLKSTRAAVAAVLRLRLKIEGFADIGEQLYILECKALGTEDGPEKDALLKQIEGLNAKWNEALGAIESNYSSTPAIETDDRISLRHPPGPRMQWDKRPFQPLIMKEEEAWPLNRLSLVFATPRPRPVGDDPDFHEWVQDFVFGLYGEPKKSITAALDTMQFGLSDIVKDCPSLRDPSKGGRLDMDHLRVRMLTMDQIVELVKAYKDWPFKPPGSDHSGYYRHKAQQFSSKVMG
jgi:transcription factor 1